MKLQQVGRQSLRSRGGRTYASIYETPSGIKVAKTNHGYYPVTRDGQINKKHKFGGKINEYEVWERVGKRHVSVMLREVGE